MKYRNAAQGEQHRISCVWDKNLIESLSRKINSIKNIISSTTVSQFQLEKKKKKKFDKKCQIILIFFSFLIRRKSLGRTQYFCLSLLIE
jgi:hypothetical protein